ncbi:glycosyltransferase [Paenibacillus planticolens]|uniref:Glycosyltransferase n=1 Tax=Paenibacillus planticolens TaxID=2654976 RepID=A0ABX1ZRN5_9BACL|nr:glycosyltransferase family A protein [Paenibacillus planticolens]NOV02338.1 glycosyltransferase [Paenibacillus planticolens]
MSFAGLHASTATKGVSIIACTNNSKFINNIFRNYNNQIGVNKELIIIVNRDDVSLIPYRNKAKHLENVSIYRMPEKISLGNCLNFAIARAKYEYISKFDDDDYYAPNYLRRSMSVLIRKEVDVVWKSSVYVYLHSKKSLLLRNSNRGDRLVGFVAGGTIMFKKKVFNRVKFANISLGEDSRFLKKCRARGFKIYSTDKFNYVYIRRKNPKSHTMKVQDRYWLKNSKLVKHTLNYKGLVRQ